MSLPTSHPTDNPDAPGISTPRFSDPRVAAVFETVTRGAESLTTPAELANRLAESYRSGRPLRVKLGMDPTAPDIHLGHCVVLRRLRAFQDAGHKAVLIIGDYTARIGDPSGKSKTRPMLSGAEIDANATTYLEQAGRILDLSSPDRYEVRRNSQWLSQLGFADVLKLCASMTLGQMMERETFTARYKAGEPIGLHEMLYPLMQGHDSVVVAADVELGGSDQLFNLGVGRDLQRLAGQAPQVCLTTPLLIGTDGRNKMSKSLGNYIAVNDSPFDVFGKTMRLPDDRMASYLALLTDEPPSAVATLLDPTLTPPHQAKKHLAGLVTELLHGPDGRQRAQAEWKTRIEDGGLPSEIPEVIIPAEQLETPVAQPADESPRPDPVIWLPKLLTLAGLAASTSEGRRAIEAGGVRLNETVISDPKATPSVRTGDVLQIGKRKVVRLRVGPTSP